MFNSWLHHFVEKNFCSRVSVLELVTAAVYQPLVLTTSPMSTVRLPSPFTLPIKVYRVSLKSSRNLVTISLSSQACRHPQRERNGAVQSRASDVSLRVEWRRRSTLSLDGITCVGRWHKPATARSHYDLSASTSSRPAEGFSSPPPPSAPRDKCHTTSTVTVGLRKQQKLDTLVSLW